jgi:hypothetical protein
MRRHGVLELLVVLPDGSKALVPARWTDTWATENVIDVGTLGSLADLLHAVTVVAALLPDPVPPRVEAGGQPGEEATDVRDRSTRPGSAWTGGTAAGRTRRLARAGSSRRARRADPVDRQDDRTGTERLG